MRTNGSSTCTRAFLVVTFVLSAAACAEGPTDSTGIAPLDGDAIIAVRTQLAAQARYGTDLVEDGDAYPDLDGPPRHYSGRSAGPDLMAATISEPTRWGRVGDITAYSVGTAVCNMGDEVAAYELNTSEHPITVQHMYRLMDGQMEHIGMSWAVHAFFAQNGTVCSVNCPYDPGAVLHPNCSDFQSANLNGLQPNMAPRWQVNAATGVFPYPWESPAMPAVIGRRLQVHDADLHPPDNPGALYFIEVHYITHDETTAGNHYDNTAYRRVEIDWDEQYPTTYDVVLAGGYSTVQQSTALDAWQEVDPAVTIEQVDVESDGRIMLGYRVTSLGGGMYRYEYALYNMNSHRSVESFSIPLPTDVTASNEGFHDVDYHSNDRWDGTDWSCTTVAGDSVSWATIDYWTEPKANALRWATTYNFRFDADRPPKRVEATLELFRPGTPDSVTIAAAGPAPVDPYLDCNSNGTEDYVDLFEGTSLDCNDNEVPDECDTAAATSLDCNTNSVPDECEVDCNTNGVPDDCDITAGTSPDCNSNQIPDECDLATGSSLDCNTNAVPDECDLAGATSLDCNTNSIPDECEVDCNTNGVPDDCDVRDATSLDCNGNIIPDECEVDCNSNGVPDDCDIAAGTSEDCNGNDVPDSCDIAGGTSTDLNFNNVPDECDAVVPALSEWGLAAMILLFVTAAVLVFHRSRFSRASVSASSDSRHA